MAMAADRVRARRKGPRPLKRSALDRDAARTCRKRRLRHMPIDSARVSKADGSQSLEVPAERGAVLRRAAEEFEQRVFLSTLNDIRNFCEAYGIEEPRSKSRASGIPRVFKFLVTMDVADVERMLDDRMFSGPAQLGPVADAIRGKAKEYRDAAIDHS